MSRWKWHINSKSFVEWREELDVGVPSSSLLKMLEREGRDIHVVGGIAFSGVDLGPKGSSVGIQAWFIGLNPFLAFLLVMVEHHAEDAGLSVPVGIIVLRVACFQDLCWGRCCCMFRRRCCWDRLGLDEQPQFVHPLINWWCPRWHTLCLYI